MKMMAIKMVVMMKRVDVHDDDDDNDNGKANG